MNVVVIWVVLWQAVAADMVDHALVLREPREHRQFRTSEVCLDTDATLWHAQYGSDWVLVLAPENPPVIVFSAGAEILERRARRACSARFFGLKKVSTDAAVCVYAAHKALFVFEVSLLI